MLSPVIRNRAPAAACRRCLGYLQLVAFLLPAALTGCSRPEPAGRWEGVRRALDRSVHEVRGEDPVAARHLERLIAEAERVTAAERAAPPWRRRAGRVEAAWEHAADTARRRVREARAVASERRQRLAGLLRLADARVEAGRARRGRAGMAGREAAVLAAAEFRVAAAHRLAAAGDLDAAIVQAGEALGQVDELEAAWNARHQRFADPAMVREWRLTAERTVAESRHAGGAAIVIDKLHRRLVAYRSGLQVAEFAVELGSGGLGRKRFAGDRATPEGLYRVVQKKSGGATRFHVALLIDYPNAEDKRRYREGVAAGEIAPRTGIGGLIEIHGGGGAGRDWTDGCVALTDRDMDRLYSLVTVGTPVTIVGAL